MKLIQNGQPQFGISTTPWEDINYLDYPLRSPMGKVLANWQKHLKYKHFQYFGVISDPLLAGCALVHAPWASILFVYVYHTQRKELRQWQFKDVASLFSTITNHPTQGISRFKRGNVCIEFINQHSPREKSLRVTIPDELTMNVCFSETVPTFQPMCLTSPCGYDGWIYAQKVAGVSCQGEIECEFGRFEMAAINGHAHHDWSGGYMRRETVWKWACLSGVHQGRSIGLNLSCGVNETSFSENCFWIDGKLQGVGQVVFELNRSNLLAPWRIVSHDGQIDLTFEPEGYHQEKFNALLVASHFKQFFGRFRGQIGENTVSDMYGFAEDQYAKW